MSFPEVDRVIYKNNPLEEVIAQLRFPSILKIDAEIPASFQDKIREDFPGFSETSETQLEIPLEMKRHMPAEIIKHMMPASDIKNYEFLSEDGHWKVNLTRSFIALSTINYTRWEEFKEKLEIILEALVNIYQPSYFSRIGLRYIDTIRPSKLKLEDKDWNKLLKDFVLGVLSIDDLRQLIENYETKYEMRLSDKDSIVRVFTKFFNDEENNESNFQIDSDFYCLNKTELGNAINRLDFFNSQATRLIRYYITETLHKAMEPKEI